jgi:DNA-binding CsgD family transcriptional regulator
MENVIRDEFADAAHSVRELGELEGLASGMMNELGFPWFMLGAPGGFRSIFGRWNRPYLERYFAGKYNLIDPVARQVSESWLPVAWEADDYIAEGTAPSAELFRISAELGFERGISTPIYGPHGSRRILVAIYGAGGPAFRRSLRQLQNELMIVGHHLASAHYALTRDLQQQPVLSPREQECLTWTFNGKTAWEVAKIIGISERTVHFHVQNAMGKLGASSKHHACMKAAQLGLIAA